MQQIELALKTFLREQRTRIGISEDLIAQETGLRIEEIEESPLRLPEKTLSRVIKAYQIDYLDFQTVLMKGVNPEMKH